MHNCVVKLDWGEGKGSWSYVVLFCIYLCIQCLTPLMLKVQNHTLLRWLVNAALCDIGCQWHLAGQWPYVGTLQKQKDSSYKSIIVKSGANHLIIPWNTFEGTIKWPFMYNLGAIMFTVSTKQLLFIFPIEPYLKNCGGSHLVFFNRN